MYFLLQYIPFTIEYKIDIKVIDSPNIIAPVVIRICYPKCND